MKKLFFFLLVIIPMISLKAQSDQSSGADATSRSVYAEILGGGIGFSGNFDSRFRGANGFGFRAGIGVLPATGATILTVPLGLNYITGSHSSHFEAEFTATVFTVTNAKFNGKTISPVFFYPHIGYRYSKPTRSFLGRIYVGPLFFAGHVLPFAGISLGYTL
jgi:hypothetical protein